MAAPCADLENAPPEIMTERGLRRAETALALALALKQEAGTRIANQAFSGFMSHVSCVTHKPGGSS